MKGKRIFNLLRKHFLQSFILTALCTASAQTINAQEVMMAKGNKTIGISYGMTNVFRTYLNSYLTEEFAKNNAENSFTYTTKFTNPIQTTFEYAVSDYTTVGASFNFYYIHLTETKLNLLDTMAFETKGIRGALQIRAVRYFVQKPKAVCYAFIGGGARFRLFHHNTDNMYELNTARIHQVPETNPNTYSPLSLDAGLGVKFLVTRKIGVFGEVGMMTGIGQIGIFYEIKNKWRRSNDNIGW